MSFFYVSAFSYTIKGAVSYTVESARQIAFSGVKKQIDMSEYKNYFEDENFESNISAMAKNKTKYKNRKITKFSDGSYSIRYLNNYNVTYYYSDSGRLQSIDYNENGDFPLKSIKYKDTGLLEAVALSVSSDEQYVFDAEGNFDGHWIGKNGYDENGNFFGTRE